MKVIKILGFATLMVGIGPASRADVTDDVFSDEQRLQGFREHEREAEKFDARRLSGLEEYKKSKHQAEQSSSPEAIAEYKEVKAKEDARSDEKGAAYRKDLLEREEALDRFEILRRAYAHLKEVARRQKHRNILLTEDQELGLDGNSERIDLSHRLLYGGKPLAGYVEGDAAKKSGGSSGGAAPSNSYPPAPDFNSYEPPPPIPYEENSPPPPPPMFDEPEF